MILLHFKVKMMNKLSLFSGIGGDDLASEWAGITTVCMVEKDKYCQRVLKKNFPGIPIIEDVKDVTKETLANAINGGLKNRRIESSFKDVYNGNENIRPKTQKFCDGSRQINIIAGGFPCQPHSVAGKHKGSDDERNLWPEFRRIIGEIKSRWIVGENVPGIFSSDAGRFFGEVVRDLAEMGYSVGWCTFGAVDVGALHRRNRVFIVAHSVNSSDFRWGESDRKENGVQGINRTALCPWESGRTGIVADSTISGLERPEPEGRTRTKRLFTQCGEIPDSEFVNDNGWRYGTSQEGQSEQTGILGSEYWQSEPDVGRVANGIPHRVDRLKGLGNAVVPQAAYEVYRGIMEIETQQMM